MVVLVGFVGQRLGESLLVSWQLAGLFIVNSIIYFSLFRQFPTLGTAMLIFMYILNLAALGYFVLAASSFA